MPDEQYAKEHVTDGKNIFLHHMPVGYYKLMLRQYP